MLPVHLCSAQVDGLVLCARLAQEILSRLMCSPTFIQLEPESLVELSLPPYVDGRFLARHFAVFRSDRLRPYVRPGDALVRERWPRWFSATRVSKQPCGLVEGHGGIGVSRVMDRSIAPSARYLARSGIIPARSAVEVAPGD